MAKLSVSERFLSKSDPILATLVAKYGPIETSSSQDYFVDLVDCIVSQQLSIKAAATIFSRVKTLYSPKQLEPKLILETEDQKLRDCGLSWAKVSYVKDLCQKVLDKTIQLDKLDSLPDEEVITQLVAVKGIGRWSAEMVLMFSLNRPDIFSDGDMGIQNAMIRLYKLKKGKSLKKKMQRIAKTWSPYRTLACRYLWKSLGNKS